MPSGGNLVVFLELRRHSRVTTGISAFPLGWPWEAQSSPRLAMESWGLCSSHRRAEETSPPLHVCRACSPPGQEGVWELAGEGPAGKRPRKQGGEQVQGAPASAPELHPVLCTCRQSHGRRGHCNSLIVTRLVIGD